MSCSSRCQYPTPNPLYPSHGSPILLGSPLANYTEAVLLPTKNNCLDTYYKQSNVSKVGREDDIYWVLFFFNFSQFLL